MTPTLIPPGTTAICTGCIAAFNPGLYRGATGPGIDVPPGHPAMKDDKGRLWHIGCALRMEAERT